MLRSRTIAEGIRAVYPAVIVGKYTPEELETVADGGEIGHGVAANEDIFNVPEQRAANDDTLEPAMSGKARPPASLPVETVEGHVTAIGNAPTLDVLRRTYADAYNEARNVGDERRMRTFVNAYEARKAELNDGSAA